MATTEDAAAAAISPPANAISEEEVSALLEKNQSDGVRPYDFTAQRINRTQLPMLEIVAKSFADRIGASLSGLLGRDALVQFTALDTAKAGDLQAALPVPASLAIVRLKPLPGSAFVTVDPGHLLLVLLDGFFGGIRAARPMIRIGRGCACRVALSLALILRNFAVGTGLPPGHAGGCRWNWKSLKQETNPRLMNLGRSAGRDVGAEILTVEFGTRSGRIDWLIPEKRWWSFDSRDIDRLKPPKPPVRRKQARPGRLSLGSGSARCGSWRPARCWRRPRSAWASWCA